VYSRARRRSPDLAESTDRRSPGLAVAAGAGRPSVARACVVGRPALSAKGCCSGTPFVLFVSFVVISRAHAETGSPDDKTRLNNDARPRLSNPRAPDCLERIGTNR
jgi:hypothetical protein